VGLLKILVASALCVGSVTAASAQTMQMPDFQAAPMEHDWDSYPFSLKYSDGRTLTSEELRGKMVFIKAWASWCAPCKPSLPKFAPLYQKHIGNPDVKVLSVHFSDRHGRFDSAGEILASKGLYYPVLEDPDGELVKTIGKTTASFGVPHYVLMDGTGKIISRYGEINDKVIMDVENKFRQHSRAARRATNLAYQNP